MIESKKTCITDGAGFIGSTLASRLANRNVIVLFDNLARNTLQHTSLSEHRNVKLVQGDILDYEATRRAMDGAHIVVHAAAIAGIDTMIKSPLRTMYGLSFQCWRWRSFTRRTNFLFPGSLPAQMTGR
jgi:UDP-glucose 4-epimerase